MSRRPSKSLFFVLLAGVVLSACPKQPAALNPAMSSDRLALSVPTVRGLADAVDVLATGADSDIAGPWLSIAQDFSTKLRAALADPSADGFVQVPPKELERGARAMEMLSGMQADKAGPGEAPVEAVEPDQPEDKTPEDPIADAFAAAAEEDWEGAVAIADAFMTERAALGADVPELRVELAEWLSRTERKQEALDMLDALSATRDSYADYVRAAEPLRNRLQAELAGENPEALALSKAERRKKSGNFDGAISALASLRPDKLTPKQAELAAAILDWAQDARLANIRDTVLAVEAILATEGPYTAAEVMLDQLAKFAPGPDRDEPLNRLRANLDKKRLNVATEALEAADTDSADLRAVRDLIAAEKYDEALSSLRDIDAKGLEAEVASLRTEASDSAVRVMREEASRAFSRARRTKKIEAKRKELDLAKTLIDKAMNNYPHSSYGSRLTENLQSIKNELAKLPPLPQPDEPPKDEKKQD